MSTVVQQHRAEAARARQQVRDQRSVSEQILLLRERPGQSAKEVARLTKKL